MEDHEIIELYWARQERAVEESDRKYGAYCHAIARNILGSREDAEECVWGTWLGAWNAMPPKRPNYLRLFFAKITRNLAFHRYEAARAEKRGGGNLELCLEELSGVAGTGGDPATAAEARALTEAVNAFLRKLPEREAGIFLRRYFFSESAKTIARRYGISANAVNVSLSRTRKRLRAHLGEEGLL